MKTGKTEQPILNGQRLTSRCDALKATGLVVRIRSPNLPLRMDVGPDTFFHPHSINLNFPVTDANGESVLARLTPHSRIRQR
jgi:hypothetical protein